MQLANRKYHIVMYYLKYYCKFNYIKHFWYSTKKWAYKNYNYTLNNF